MKLEKATVRWFDKRSGEGMIRVDSSQKSIYVHWSAIDVVQDLQKPKEVWGVLFSGQKVQVRVLEDYSFIQIQHVTGA